MYNNIKEDVENQLSVKEQPNYDEYEVTDDDMDDEIYSGSDSDSETNSVVDVENTNPVYDDVRYDYSLYTDYSEKELCDIFNYKQKTDKNNREILDIINRGEELINWN